MADANPAMTQAEPQEPRDTSKQVRLSIPAKEVVPAPERPVINRVRKGRKPRPFVPAHLAKAAPVSKPKATAKPKKAGKALDPKV
jgi:hypothetical protein